MRSAAFRAGLAGLAAALFFGFIALGTWQVQRRAWKLDLIARVEQRVHAAPVAAPGPARWAGINTADDSYRHVQLSGLFLNKPPTLVQAVTELGGGFWVLAPMQRDDGSVVLVNRGFVTPERRERAAVGLPAGDVTITGLLRISEPGGAFLRHNDPAAGRWYSRDVQAIADALGLTHGPAPVAPYFVDADASAQPRAAASATSSPLPRADGNALPGDHGPVGGLTVVAFQNNHLVYAITWYTLALMVAGAAWFVTRSERGARRR